MHGNLVDLFYGLWCDELSFSREHAYTTVYLTKEKLNDAVHGSYFQFHKYTTARANYLNRAATVGKKTSRTTYDCIYRCIYWILAIEYSSFLRSLGASLPFRSTVLNYTVWWQSVFSDRLCNNRKAFYSACLQKIMCSDHIATSICRCWFTQATAGSRVAASHSTDNRRPYTNDDRSFLSFVIIQDGSLFANSNYTAVLYINVKKQSS